jgi:hypothetical protein
MQEEVQTRRVPVQTVRMVEEEQFRTVPVTVQKPVVQRVTNYVPERRTRWVPHETVRKVPVTTVRYVQEERVEQIPVRTCKMVAEQKTIEVPRTTSRWVAETSTRLVPRTVMMRIPITPCVVDTLSTSMIDTSSPTVVHRQREVVGSERAVEGTPSQTQPAAATPPAMEPTEAVEAPDSEGQSQPWRGRRPQLESRDSIDRINAPPFRIST